MKSKCCNADTKVASGDEGTSHYVCTGCGNAADAIDLRAFDDLRDMTLEGWNKKPDLVLVIRVTIANQTDRRNLLEVLNNNKITAWIEGYSVCFKYGNSN
jgi:hypothetical protein